MWDQSKSGTPLLGFCFFLTCSFSGRLTVLSRKIVRGNPDFADKMDPKNKPSVSQQLNLVVYDGEDSEWGDVRVTREEVGEGVMY